MIRSTPSYLKGRGVTLPIVPSEVHNLFRISNKYPLESKPFVHAKLTAGEYSLIHILIKELYFVVLPGGYLIIDYHPEGSLTFDSIEQSVWWVCHKNYRLVEHSVGPVKNRLVIQKLHPMLAAGDRIDAWTFGIITNGERDDWLTEMISSIRKQKIPQYEIIVCGQYKKRKEKDFTYIPFNERAGRGWITMKKNLIGQKARYENICMLHDRIVLDDGWYTGMKKYGNGYELLGCVQIERATGEHAGDWLTLGGPVGTSWRVSRLDYRDWDYFTYLSGQLTIIKKRIWSEVLWDNTRYWNEAEDADITYRARDRGYLARFNPYATTTALSWRHGKLPFRYNPREGLLPKDMWRRRVMRTTARMVGSVPGLRQAMLGSYHTFSKTVVYKYFIYH